MTGFTLAGLITETAAVVSAVLLARRRAEHRPAAVALVVFMLADLVRLPMPATPSGALVYLDGAAVLAQEATLPALILAACSPGAPLRAAAPVFGAWLLASVVVGALYPSPLVTGAGLARVYLAADLLGLLVTVAAFVQWMRARRPMSTSHAVAGLFATLDVALLTVPLSPWRVGLFDRWDAAQFGLLTLFGIITLIQGILLCLPPK